MLFSDIYVQVAIATLVLIFIILSQFPLENLLKVINEI